MPDFVAALERRLRGAAPDLAYPHPTRRRHGVPFARRVAGLAAAAGVLGVTAIMMAPSGNHGATPAYGKPLILNAAAVDVTRQLGGGIMVTQALGAGARLDQARPVPAFGGTAYLIQGEKGWCLSAPDPAASRPEIERGVTCMSSAEFLRFGISVRLGRYFVAAIPQGVRNPTIELADGTVRELHPSDLGVVTLDQANPGTVITLYGPDGSTRRDRVTSA